MRVMAAFVFQFPRQSFLALLVLLCGADLLVLSLIGHGALVLVHLNKYLSDTKNINIPQSVPCHIWSPRTFGTACPANGNSQLQFAENFVKIPEHLDTPSRILFHIWSEKKPPLTRKIIAV